MQPFTTSPNAALRRRVDLLLKLRNRIAHHEPIIRRDTSRDYAELMTTLRWMNPAMHDWIASSCRVPDIMRRKP